MLRRHHSLLLCFAKEGPEWYHSKANQGRNKKSEEEEERESSSKSNYEKYNADFFVPASEELGIKKAYSIFGFKMSDTVTEEIVNKKYKLLAKKYHPDAGGTPQQFQALKEAHKLMLSVKHEPKNPKQETKFTKVSRAEALHRTDHTNVQENEWDVTDAFAVLIMVPLVLGIWYWHNMDITVRLSDARRRMAVDEMRPQKREEKAQHEWHPWRASNDDKEFITNVLEDRARRNNVATTGWVEGSSAFEEQLSRANERVDEFNKKHKTPERAPPPKLTVDGVSPITTSSTSTHESFGPTSMVGQISPDEKSPYSNNNNSSLSSVGTYSGASAARPHRSVFAS